MLAVASVLFREVYRSFSLTVNDGPPADHAEPYRSLSEDDQRFAYAVVAGVLQRSVDRCRFVATLFVGLFAAQAAIVIFVVDKNAGPANHLAFVRLDWAIAIAIGGVALSMFTRESPESFAFTRAFRFDPIETREIIIEDGIARSRFNNRMGLGQSLLLGSALALTVSGTLAIHLRTAVS